MNMKNRKDAGKSTVVRVVFPISVDKHFDYLGRKDLRLKPGMRVLVSFRGRRRVGLVVSLSYHSSYSNLNPIIKVLDTTPILSGEHIRFARRVADSYLYSLGEMTFLMLPPPLRGAKMTDMLPWRSKVSRSKGRVKIVKAVDFRKRFSMYSGIVKDTLTDNSVVICFPLLSHLEDAFSFLKREFADKLVIMHSYLSDREVLDNWLKIREGKKLVLGTRGVLFFYPADLKLIVVEEENSPHYFHPEKPYYHLVDMAHLLHRFKKTDLILSSDFPSLFAYRHYRGSISGGEEPVVFPKFKIFDYTDSSSYKKRRGVLTPLVVELVRKNIEEGRKVLFLWSKGWFSMLMRCSVCGKVLECSRCSSFLRFSSKKDVAFCPRCGYSQDVSKLCPNCGEGYMRPLGVGVERLESILKRFFPEVGIKRWEEGGDAKILISTYQALNVSLSHIPMVDVALALDVDSMLSLSDYDSSFQLFMTLKKVSRFVRDEVCIFTYNSNHYIWEGLQSDWHKFYKKELTLRKQLQLPPFGTIVKFILRGKSKNALQKNAESLYNVVKSKGLNVFGPLEEVPFKLRDKYRYSVVVKGQKRQKLVRELKSVVDTFRRSSYKLAVVIR